MEINSNQLDKDGRRGIPHRGGFTHDPFPWTQPNTQSALTSLGRDFFRL